MPYIILDRDGVINFDSEEYIKSPNEWLPIPGSLEAIAALNQSGFKVLVATNQSGIARGLYDVKMLIHIHIKLTQELAAVGGHITEIFFCPHHPDDACICRKPKPGMLEQIKNRYPIQLTETFFIGDSITDIQAAQTVGCKPILVLTGKGQTTLAENPELKTIPHFLDLAGTVNYVIAETNDAEKKT